MNRSIFSKISVVGRRICGWEGCNSTKRLVGSIVVGRMDSSTQWVYNTFMDASVLGCKAVSAVGLNHGRHQSLETQSNNITQQAVSAVGLNHGRHQSLKTQSNNIIGHQN